MNEIIILIVFLIPALAIFLYLLFNVISKNEENLIKSFDNGLLGKLGGIKNPGEGIPRLSYDEVKKLSKKDKMIWIVFLLFIFILFFVLSYLKFYKNFTIPGWI